ncbi:uncharacterized protein LOC110850506 isoform X2 [Folsomia candida]|uniref:uncharacterized protein LOC110850506 isoform X2 n=1 Tax=Folsomia candida TaxID=158441 RepID=UPI0016051D55|nr:uncharacterized protein LOC110850506 isoform X2 [Folsomia candida]XP_035707632.1 uncharacterized protein LOC110850506 isoform X2 [Folsomia candida]XP_035707633.1 uncharacterized protein LOC110850506 isoform X2 [Folsomia candida]XP_035707634.1 uncharacterized protein LOC110850506 isoform X2 [Folsomia candida]XP_035707635.1 uncharacterized protein LOC110850506 isoform X2 [Folsomia candida]
MLEEDKYEEGDSLCCSNNGVNLIPNPDSEPVFIPDIIPHLCKFLTLQDIKQCRMVSHPWNYAATPVLKSRSMIKIRLSPENLKECDEPANYEQAGSWASILDAMEFRPVNINLLISGQLESKMDPKIFTQLKNLLINIQLISIQYATRNQTAWEEEIIQKIMQTSSTTLEELRCQSSVRSAFPCMSDIIFPKLKKLVLNYSFHSVEHILSRIGQAMADAFPIIEHLGIGSSHLYIISMRSKILETFPSTLNSLEVIGLIDAQDMNDLLKISVPLKTLRLSLIYYDDTECSLDERPIFLYNLLNKHSPSLEKLSISLSEYDADEFEWKFPVFPVLKSLTIFNCRMSDKLKFECGIGSGHSSRINYKECFPALERLQVFSNSNDEAAFITGECSRCPIA